jgi:hypothetical protein
MELLFAAADAASRSYAASWRRGNIIRAQTRLRENRQSRRLINFYLDDIDREVDFILLENTLDAA